MAASSLNLAFILLNLAFIHAFAQHGADEAGNMGPVAFMWPPDRQWGAAQDNTAPCGSASGVVNRTSFPLLNGQVALVAQDESWSIQVAISHENNPTTNDDFTSIIDAFRIPELDEGHQCFPVPNPSADVEAGSNATLQIKYTSDFDNDRNETFYACADITYVSTSQFTYQVPCFNATIDDFNVTEPSATSATASATSTAISGSSDSSTQANSSRISGGAIAGIVIGALVGVAGLVGGLFLLWRRSQRNKRQRSQEASMRAVKWVDPADGASASSGNQIRQDIAMDDMRR